MSCTFFLASSSHTGAGAHAVFTQFRLRKNVFPMSRQPWSTGDAIHPAIPAPQTDAAMFSVILAPPKALLCTYGLLHALLPRPAFVLRLARASCINDELSKHISIPHNHQNIVSLLRCCHILLWYPSRERDKWLTGLPKLTEYQTNKNLINTCPWHKSSCIKPISSSYTKT